MQKLRRCCVCEQMLPLSEMRKSLKGKITHYCIGCKGLCRCKKCGKIKPVSEFRKDNKCKFEDGEPISDRRCLQCHAEHGRNSPKGRERFKRLCKMPTIEAFITLNVNRYKYRCKQKGNKSDLSRKYLLDLWIAQGGKCYYTGKPIELVRGYGQWKGPSLDKMAPWLPYVRGNVVWTSRRINTMKSNLTAQEFIELCRAITEHHSGHP